MAILGVMNWVCFGELLHGVLWAVGHAQQQQHLFIPKKKKRMQQFEADKMVLAAYKNHKTKQNYTAIYGIQY